MNLRSRSTARLDISRCRHCGFNPCRCSDAVCIGQPPCGHCDRCMYEQAAFYATDHPALITHEELARL